MASKPPPKLEKLQRKTPQIPQSNESDILKSDLLLKKAGGVSPQNGRSPVPHHLEPLREGTLSKKLVSLSEGSSPSVSPGSSSKHSGSPPSASKAMGSSSGTLPPPQKRSGSLSPVPLATPLPKVVETSGSAEGSPKSSFKKIAPLEQEPKHKTTSSKGAGAGGGGKNGTIDDLIHTVPKSVASGQTFTLNVDARTFEECWPPSSLRIPSLDSKDYNRTTFEYIGTTSSGTVCKSTFSRQTDREDNDSSESRTIGTLTFSHYSDMGRDWGYNQFSVSIEGINKPIYSHKEEFGRSGPGGTTTVGSLDEVRAILVEVAANEGMDLDTFLRRCPRDISGVFK